MALLQRSPDNPYHLSVGAVLLNSDNKVALHHFKEEDTPFGAEVYCLMRESVEDNETLESAVARGLDEEFGAKGAIEYFIGGETVEFMEQDKKPMHKTTLYFVVRLKQIDVSKRKQDDPEYGSLVKWFSLPEAINLFTQQANKLPHRPDLHEASIIERTLKFL
jgi:ADP-ribose pyrophosphatase YjhB (NUDIX family)